MKATLTVEVPFPFMRDRIQLLADLFATAADEYRDNGLNSDPMDEEAKDHCDERAKFFDALTKQMLDLLENLP